MLSPKTIIDEELSYMYVWPSLLICYRNELIQFITVINAMQIFIIYIIEWERLMIGQQTKSHFGPLS